MDPQAGPRGTRPRGWYSISEGDPGEHHRHHAFYRRRTLARYFANRHAHRERLRLRAVVVGARNGRAAIEFRVERTADDLGDVGLANNRIAFGKGALDCDRRKIFVWSMVHAPDPPATGPLCPPGEMACSRRR